jgi:hypothetical protein
LAPQIGVIVFVEVAVPEGGVVVISVTVMVAVNAEVTAVQVKFLFVSTEQVVASEPLTETVTVSSFLLALPFMVVEQVLTVTEQFWLV